MNKIGNEALGKLAYDRIKNMILANRFQPGQKIVQEKLAAELGISRTPLRDALQMLEAEHLVESIPRRGIVVRAFSKEEIIEIFECRIALECTAVRLFAERASQKEIGQMKKIFQPFQKQVETIDVKAYQQADGRFHDFIIRHCGNGYLEKMVDGSNLLLLVERIGLLRQPEETLFEHEAIIQAIESRHPSMAEKMLRQHLVRSQATIEKKT